MGCTYNGKDYSVGSAVCQNGWEYVCYDTGWEASGSACNHAADGEVIRQVAVKKDGGTFTVGESKLDGPDKLG